MKFNWLVIALALVGCGNKNGGDTGTDTDTDVITIDDDCSAVSATSDALVQTATHFAFTSPEAGTPTIEYGLDGQLDHSLAGSTSGTVHEIVVPLLRSGATYTWRGVVQTESGETVACAEREFAVPPQPQGILGIEVTHVDEAKSEVAGGYVLFTTLQADDSFVGMIDGEGHYVFTQALDDPQLATVRARLGADGKSVLYNYYDRDRIDDLAGVIRVGFDGSGYTDTRTLTAHHDFVELPDGKLGWMGYDRRDDVVMTGTPPASAAVRCIGAGGGCPVVTDNVQEADEGSASESSTEIMNFFDDNTVAPFWGCEHAQGYGEFVPDYYEWTHGNSFNYVESENAYYAMSRYLDALFKIDRASGEILWQLGGTHGDFTTSDALWDHGHYSDIWPGGFLVFDNGDHKAVPVSRVAEFSWDEVNKTAELVWEHEEPTGSFIGVLGDAKRLPSGNLLIAWSQKGVLQEVTPDHEVVWEAQAAIGGIISRVTFIEGR